MFSLLAKISSVENCARHPGFLQCARVEVSWTCALSLHLHWKFWTFSNLVSEFSHVIVNVSLNLWHRVVNKAFIVRYGDFWIVSTPHRLIQYHSFLLNLRSRFSRLFCSQSPFQCRLDRFRPLYQWHPLLKQQELLQNNQQSNLWCHRNRFHPKYLLHELNSKLSPALTCPCCHSPCWNTLHTSWSCRVTWSSWPMRETEYPP